MKNIFKISIISSVCIMTSLLSAGAQAVDCVRLTYNLQLGQTDSRTGGDVSNLQNFLFQNGYRDTEPNGRFGASTRREVIDFQESQGLPLNGRINASTRALIERISCESKNDFDVTPSDVPVNVPPVQVSIDTNRTYTKDGVVYTYDLYYPNNWQTSKKLPSLIWVHGGSWTGGDKSGERMVAESIASQGVMVFVPNYRMTTDPYNGVDDISNMVKILFQSDIISALNLDETKISIGGSSAGGHLALMGAANSQSAPLRCVLSVAGPTDLVTAIENQTFVRDYPGSTDIVRRVFGTNPDVLRKNSPSYTAHSFSRSSKFLLTHERQDNLVPFSQSENFSTILKNRGFNVTENFLNDKNYYPAIRPADGQYTHVFTDQQVVDIVSKYFKANCGTELPITQTVITPKVAVDTNNSQSKVLGASVECLNIQRNLHRGNESVEVKKLQTFLFRNEFLTETPTGFYGDKTIKAVKEYQSSKGISATGMVYEKTRSMITSHTCGQ